jgi:hypothetical protein
MTNQEAAMKPTSRLGLSISLLTLAIALPALAYEYPLSDSAIRDAYFLGKSSSDKISELFDKYTQKPPVPKTGAHIASVVLETPYLGVVEHSREMLNYSAPAAEKDFLGKPAIFRLRVQIDLTDSYGWQIPSPPGTIHMRPDDFWKDFAVRLVQKEEIPSKSLRGSPIYSSGGEGSPSVLTGALIELTYDAEKIKSEDAKVEVLTPTGEEVEVTFDLATLR